MTLASDGTLAKRELIYSKTSNGFWPDWTGVRIEGVNAHHWVFCCKSAIVDEPLKKFSFKASILNAIVDFELLRPDLEHSVPRSDRVKGGRPPYNVLMFRVLILQASHSLSDERISDHPTSAMKNGATPKRPAC